jgi:hypothetical protein
MKKNQTGILELRDEMVTWKEIQYRTLTADLEGKIRNQ